MGKSQRTKGAVGEREVAHIFSAALGKTYERNIGQARDGGCDIDVGPLAVEVKRRKTLGTIYGWLQQCVAAAAPRGAVPVVVCRQDNGEWLAVVRLSDFTYMASAALGHIEVPDGGIF